MSLEGNVKVREEREIEVQSAEEAMALFENLGYAVVRRYQKMREEWQLGGVTIALDHTPIGDFAEFEGAAPDGGEELRLDPSKAERRLPGLYEEHLKLHSGYRRDGVPLDPCRGRGCR